MVIIDPNPDLNNSLLTKSRNTKSLLLLMISISMFYIGFNLAIFFDSVFLKELLCSPQIYDCLNENVVEQDRINAVITYNFLRGYDALILVFSLIIGGAISDNLRTKFGNRLPILLIGAILTGLGYILLPIFIIPKYPDFIPQEPLKFFPSAPFITGAIIYTFIAIGIGFMLSAGLSFISELFTQDQRGLAGLLMVILGTFGTVLGLLINFFFVDIFIVSGKSNEINWYVISFIIGGIIIFFGLLTFFKAPRVNPKYPRGSILRDIKNTPYYIFSMGNKDKASRDLKFGLLVTILWGGAGFIIVANLPNFIGDLRSNNYVDLFPGTVLLIMGLSGAFFSIFTGILLKKLGKARTGIIGSLIFAYFCFLISRQFFWNNTDLILISILGGISSIIIATVTVSMPADLVPKGKEGQFMGIFLASTNLMAPFMTILAGYIFANQNTILDGYSELLLLPAVFYLIAIIFLIFIQYEYRIREGFKQYQKRYLYYKGIIKGTIGKGNERA